MRARARQEEYDRYPLNCSSASESCSLVMLASTSDGMSALASSALSGSRFPSCAISNSCRAYLSRSLQRAAGRSGHRIGGGGGAGSKGGHALSDLGDRFLVLEPLHSVHVFIRLQKYALRLYTGDLRRVQLVFENQGHLRVQQGVGIVEVWLRRQESDSARFRANPGGSAAHRAPASEHPNLHRAPC
jgi:hypothetical protein